jgi:hypothetical protein
VTIHRCEIFRKAEYLHHCICIFIYALDVVYLSP